MHGLSDMLGWKPSTPYYYSNLQTPALTYISEIEHIWQLSWRTSFYRGGPVFMSALAGIDIALWDLKARKLNVPIYQLLGGKVRDKLKVYAWIGGDRPDDVKEQAYMPSLPLLHLTTDLP
jgi:L-alanine-DL-glutamate epimerase-like enolase superfamily enzyme